MAEFKTVEAFAKDGRSADPRIVCTTSCVHHFGVFDLDHFNGGQEIRGNDYHNNKLYLQIWLAELQLRCLKHPEYSHIRINGVYPGFVASGIWHTNDLKRNGISMRALVLFLHYVAITPQQGSLAITNAATSPECGRTTSGGKISQSHLGSAATFLLSRLRYTVQVVD
ncbi:hypothetical protein N7537_006798 [Penicillium hordei]|uniref:Uncharacterized protein n=1 Tax=Penicillium hordei TaxID=40994 RepID=A0AAD6E858_9EURO|nr:uncharacterized protein N7537_006798 [Penicillium hordei]KAJ5603842.1 hypothetical protein N7537_006798 [Penicillium hordei]